MAIWRERSGWTYEYLDRDVEPQELSGFEDLVLLWNERRGERAAPAWSDFDFPDFKGWHSCMAVYDVSYNPFEYTCRLSGTSLDWLYDRNLTGVTGSGLANSGAESPDAMEFSEIACTQMLITRTTGTINLRRFQRDPITFVEFPLTSDGHRATHTLEAFICPNADWTWNSDG